MFRFFTTDRNAYLTAAIILVATLFLTLAAFPGVGRCKSGHWGFPSFSYCC